MATQSYNPTEATPIVYGTAMVLLIIVLSMDAVAILLRRRFRSRMRG
jgi:ABC-type phosphate transport system permease subunit